MSPGQVLLFDRDRGSDLRHCQKLCFHRSGRNVLQSRDHRWEKAGEASLVHHDPTKGKDQRTHYAWLKTSVPLVNAMRAKIHI